MNEGAIAYARKHALHALLVARNDSIETEIYDNDYDATRPHAIYSGTKSFWGIAALLAEQENLLRLDETVSQTFVAWASDECKSRVTLRMLLTLTAGFGFGGLGSAVPTYEAALAMPLRTEPGTRFTYGGIALQVFGAVLSRKLESARLTPREYLRARILQPAGVEIGSWRTLKDGTNPLPTGAYLTARAWLSYGTWLLAHCDEFARCFVGSSANPRYGLCWWLAPPDIFYASGSGGQALYVVPSQKLVIVHFGGGSSYKHDAFLRRISSG